MQCDSDTQVLRNQDDPAQCASPQRRWQPGSDDRAAVEPGQPFSGIASMVQTDDREERAQGSALDPTFIDLYKRLKAMASRQRQRRGVPKTLCTTELLHEVYLRMSESGNEYPLPAQFFAFAARTMRNILIDAARRRMQRKRGGDQVRLAMSDPAVESVAIDPQLALEMDDALTALEREHPRAAQVVELHFFAGLDMERVAGLLGVVRRTVDRDWRYARAFLAARAVD